MFIFMFVIMYISSIFFPRGWWVVFKLIMYNIYENNLKTGITSDI